MWCALFLVFLAFAYSEGRSANIVNGQDVDSPGKYPWQASLQYRSSRFHFCGGSVISKRFVITAAHCVDSAGASSRMVVLGQHDQNRYYGKPQEYYITRFIVHPSWRSSTITNDIALIELSSDIVYNEYIQPVGMDLEGQYHSAEQCVITGWGRLSGGGSSPNVLQEAPTSIQSARQCSQRTTRPAQVCVYNGNSGACNGDSGGPLSCKFGGEWKLVGIASFVYGSCR